MSARPGFGAVLMARRDATGLSRAALGKLAGVSDSLITYWDRGTRRTVSRGSAHRLAGVRELGLTLDDFVGVQVGRPRSCKLDYFAVLRSCGRPIRL